MIALVPVVEDNSVIVIDEPEISLHPSWQYKYIHLLDTLLEDRTGCHVIIATHSHFLVSDLPLERSRVVVFKDSNSEELEVDYIEGDTYGMSAEQVILDVFGLPSTRNYYLSLELSEALKIIARGELNDQRLIELKERFSSYLPSLTKDDPLASVIESILCV